jgi:hypothetical protein
MDPPPVESDPFLEAMGPLLDDAARLTRAVNKAERQT